VGEDQRRGTGDEEQADALNELQGVYGAEYNMHTKRGMHFSFDTAEQAWAFAREVVEAFPHVTVTIGRKQA